MIIVISIIIIIIIIIIVIIIIIIIIIVIIINITITIDHQVVTELPDVLMNFRRRKRVNEVWVLGSGLGYCALAVGMAAIAYKVAMENNLKRLER